VVAPTGIAALNARGVTIHSFFQLPFGTILPTEDIQTSSLNAHTKIECLATIRRNFRMSAVKQQVLRNLELLIIDEVSMLRADVLDALEYVLKKIRRNAKPFGGVQVLFIGDLFQLPPVTKDYEWNLLSKYYKSMFFFNALCIQKLKPVYIELKKIYRQQDEDFIRILNNLRNNMLTEEDRESLRKYVNNDFVLTDHPGYIYVTTHNYKADSINEQQLNSLKAPLVHLAAEIQGDFPERMYPIPEKMQLKKGAQVMFIKNDPSPDKNFYNGKMGVVQSVDANEVWVHFPQENRVIDVQKYEWENIQYKVDENTKEIQEEVLGTFVHYPLKLAWAITIHKSQGLTFSKAVLDVEDVFQPGQAYVALSRLQSLEGLVLRGRASVKEIHFNREVIDYADNEIHPEVLEKLFHTESMVYLKNYIHAKFSLVQIYNLWKEHLRSYRHEAVKSEKAKHKDWAESQLSNLESVKEPSFKFLSQIEAVFSQNPVNMDFLIQRLHAARQYFFKTLDEVYFELLSKIEEIKKIKRVKTYFNELSTLEEDLLKAIIGLSHAIAIAEAFKNNSPINKTTMNSEFVKSYRSNKLQEVKEHRRTSSHMLVDDDADLSFYKNEKKLSTASKTKKATTEITFELWQKHKDINKVAQERLLTQSTIYSHLGKLLKEDKVKIEELFSPDKINALTLAFDGYEETSLTPLKEKLGDGYSFEELRVFRSYLYKQN
jgi:hypothetical protein